MFNKLQTDRDLNAAINIKNLGLYTPPPLGGEGQRGLNACGVGGLPPSVKQEKECLEN